MVGLGFKGELLFRVWGSLGGVMFANHYRERFVLKHTVNQCVRRPTTISDENECRANSVNLQEVVGTLSMQFLVLTTALRTQSYPIPQPAKIKTRKP